MDPKRLQETVSAAQTGSAEAYQVLLEAYGPRLYGYFLRAMRNHHDAEDLLGELALKLVRRLKSYDDRGRFDPWLFRIAANMIRDRFRRQKVRPRAVSLSGDDDDRTLRADRMAGKSVAVDGRLLARERSDSLDKALNRLDETTREMIVLRHFSEMSFKEIAEMYECPIGTALARVHRGLKTLRRILGDENGPE